MKASLKFILSVTDHFKGHWEDPEWGRMPANQILIALAVRDLASAIQDADLRTQMHAAADKAIALNSHAVARQ